MRRTGSTGRRRLPRARRAPLQDFGQEDRRAPPRDAAGTRHATHFHVAGIVDRRQTGRQRAGRGLIVERGRLILQALVGPHLVILPTNARKRCCWPPAVAAGGRVVSALSTRWNCSCEPFCSGRPSPIRSGTMPSRIHHTLRRDRRPRPGPAKGPPLSLRMRTGRPNSAKLRSKLRRVSA